MFFQTVPKSFPVGLPLAGLDRLERFNWAGLISGCVVDRASRFLWGLDSRCLLDLAVGLF